MKVTIHGAAGQVTGSAYLVETDRAQVLVDFGMFQGGSRAETRNVVPKGLNPARLDAVLLTHAHLDHVGRLPLLLKAGYQGSIYATFATRDLAGLILRDSAKVQFHDIERQNRKRKRAGKPLLEPLYTADEVDRTLKLFRDIEFDQPQTVAEGISARYSIAGHMLGSASIELTIQEKGKTRVVVFSGDLGPEALAIVRKAVPFKRADLVFLESTYGDRDNKPLKETLAEFRTIIEGAVKRKARILVPAFAVGRTQQILYHLDELFCAGTLKPFPVYLDSPMAIEATKIYRRHPDLFNEKAATLRGTCVINRQRDHVKPTPTAQDSMKLNDAPGPCLIMAGSGMCNGGADSASSQARFVAAGNCGDDRRLSIRGFAGSSACGRSEVGEDLWRTGGREGACSYVERLQRPRRADHFAQMVQCGRSLKAARGSDSRRSAWTRATGRIDSEAT